MSLIDKIKKHWKELVLTAAMITYMSGDIDINALKKPEQEKKHDKYALIFCADTYRDSFKDENALGGGTKNTYLISIANIYESLKKLGYKQENINITYFDGKPDYTETKDGDLIKKLKEEKGREIESKHATKERLHESLETITNKAKQGDEVLLYITGHGRKNYSSGEIYFELRPVTQEDMYETIKPSELAEMLKQASTQNVTAVLDFCYSGKFGKVLYDNGIDALTAADSATVSIRSRNSQFGRDLINARTNLEADSNKDGQVTWTEAFNYSEAKRASLLQEHKKAGHYSNMEPAPGQNFTIK